jgi:quercetin dioxygenase-like cupin family protein
MLTFRKSDSLKRVQEKLLREGSIWSVIPNNSHGYRVESSSQGLTVFTPHTLTEVKSLLLELHSEKLQN